MSYPTTPWRQYVPSPCPSLQRLAVVIDDEALIRLGLRAVLEGWGWNVIDAASGADALAEIDASGRTPDVIVADYYLDQGLTGAQAIHEIQRVRASPIPAVLLTGCTDPKKAAEAAHRGFRLLLKPIDPFELRQSLDQIGFRED